jgi:hypothetical protein
MNRSEYAQGSALLAEALTISFHHFVLPVVDNYFQNINPNGRSYESLKKLSDSEVITLALWRVGRSRESSTT